MRPAISEQHPDHCLTCAEMERQGRLGKRETEGGPAEYELQRILRETEPTLYAEGFGPDQYRGHSDMRVTVLGRDYERFGVAHAVLAEALERFLEGEVR